MENNNTETVVMTAEMKAKFEAFQAAEEKKAAEEKAKAEREKYKQMVDQEVNASLDRLVNCSDFLASCKKSILDDFRTIIDMKTELFGLKKDDQRSHTFTNSEGNKRITLGVYVTDDYRDTAEDGIAIVKEYISSLANDAKTQALVNMVLKLLSRDSKGTLKASRIVQLRKIADETGNERFIEGVMIIEDAYQPAVSKQYIKAEFKDPVSGKWMNIPLGMTEADC